ncbi:MAG: cytochrome c [Deltaproteobacteria bacterium]|nr:cytochrome c [Deltaproteobacteria bacterium]
MRGTLAVFIFLLFLLATADLGRAQAKGDAKAGKTKYDQLCAGCHGTKGKGDGPAAAALNPKPRDHTDCKGMAKESDDSLFKVIKEGGQGAGRSPLMPPWKASLKDPDVQNLVAYIRSFCKK